jgi:hypothetical protein
MPTVIVIEQRLVVGQTSRGPRTFLHVGENHLDDAHWQEILERYGEGLAPYFTNGRLAVRHEIDVPDPAPPAEAVPAVAVTPPATAGTPPPPPAKTKKGKVKR